MALKLPPNTANLKIIAPLTSAVRVRSSLLQAGLTAEDLEPVDWRGKISRVMDQGQCGNCWAMSTTAVLTDRFIVQKKLGTDLELNPAPVTQCTSDVIQQGGCGGGYPLSAGKYLEQVGTVESDGAGTCPSWQEICQSQRCADVPACNRLEASCNRGSDHIVFKARANSTKPVPAYSGRGIDKTMTIVNMKKELRDGPIVGAFFVPHDFMASMYYKWDKTNGVYVRGAYNDILERMSADPRSPMCQLKAQNLGISPQQAAQTPLDWGTIITSGGGPSGHAVEIVGWDDPNKSDKAVVAGSAGKIPYWIVKNSWGKNWMHDGYYYFAMSPTGSEPNAMLGFDIPVMFGGQWFGGATTLEPDLTTGTESGSGSSTSTGGSSSTNKAVVAGGIVAGVVIVALVVFLLKK